MKSAPSELRVCDLNRFIGLETSANNSTTVIVLENTGIQLILNPGVHSVIVCLRIYQECYYELFVNVSEPKHYKTCVWEVYSQLSWP